MITNFLRYRSLLLAAVMQVVAAVPVFSGELISENFDSVPVGRVVHRTVLADGQIRGWEGSWAGELGYFEITDEKSAEGTGRSLCFHDNCPEKKRGGPVLTVDWKQASPAKGHLIVEWSWMVPVEGEFQAVQFLGGTWDDAAAILIAQNGTISIQYGPQTRDRLAAYEPGQWVKVKFDFDLASKTFSFYLNDKKSINTYGWQVGSHAVDALKALADGAPVDRHGGAVFYLDNIHVKSEP